MSRTASATTRTPAWRSSRSRRSRSTRYGSRSCCSRTTRSSGPRRCCSTANSPRPSPNGCATDCCTSPDGSRSTDDAASSASSTTGHGPRTCSPRSKSSKRSPPPSADRAEQPTTRSTSAPGHGRDHRCPQTSPRSPQRFRGSAQHRRHRPERGLTITIHTQTRPARHLRAPTARSGLVIVAILVGAAARLSGNTVTKEGDKTTTKSWPSDTQVSALLGAGAALIITGFLWTRITAVKLPGGAEIDLNSAEQEKAAEKIGDKLSQAKDAKKIATETQKTMSALRRTKGRIGTTELSDHDISAVVEETVKT